MMFKLVPDELEKAMDDLRIVPAGGWSAPPASLAETIYWAANSVPQQLNQAVQSLAKDPSLSDPALWGTPELRRWEYLAVAGRMRWSAAVDKWVSQIPTKVHIEGFEDKVLYLGFVGMHIASGDVYIAPLPLAEVWWCDGCQQWAGDLYLGRAVVGVVRDKLPPFAEVLQKGARDFFSECALAAGIKTNYPLKPSHPEKVYRQHAEILQNKKARSRILRKLDAAFGLDAEQFIKQGLDNDDNIVVTLHVCSCGQVPTLLAPVVPLMEVMTTLAATKHK